MNTVSPAPGSRPKDRARSLTGLITSVVITLILVWGVIALTNEDALWFTHRFDARATSFTIYWDGDVYTVRQGDAAYEPIMAAFADGIAKPSGYEGSVALSEESIDIFQSKLRMLEVRFDEPVQVHTRHPYLAAATYLVPLSETHGRMRRAFSFPGYVPYTSGPLNIAPERHTVLAQAVESAVTLASAK